MRLLLALTLAFALLVPAAASAHHRADPAAPPGADPMWLPEEEWVMERWMPFDEQRLYDLLGIGRGDLYRLLKFGDQSLGQIARRRGLSPIVMRSRLLAPRRRAVTPAQWSRLVVRTRRMFNQRHLAEHVLGHTYHHWSVWRRGGEIWGPSFTALERLGLPHPQMSRRSGVDRAELARRIWQRLDASLARGLAQRALTDRQAAVIRSFQHRNIDELVGDGPKLVCPLDAGAPAAGQQVQPGGDAGAQGVDRPV